MDDGKTVSSITSGASTQRTNPRHPVALNANRASHRRIVLPSPTASRDASTGDGKWRYHRRPVALWTERNRLLALADAAGKKAKTAYDVHERKCDTLDDKAYDIERRIANTVAESLAGLLVQAKLHGEVLKDSGKWIHTPALTRNVCTALERMEAAS